MFEDNYDKFESNSMKGLECISKIQVLYISIPHPVNTYYLVNRAKKSQDICFSQTILRQKQTEILHI